jgi:diaminohydroxyphosphoribosylaminopyrimidine deaminase / 5-amino-6-(5-phosphoribosylamino)uracil reductase
MAAGDGIGMKESGRLRAAMAEEALAWRALLARRRGLATTALAATRPVSPAVADLLELYGPLAGVAPGQSFAVAHLAQSLDGRIATECGASRWLSGEADLLHTHRMRALADAVLVGAGTVRHDDPQLTVRRCPGDHPVRVVIDCEHRLTPRHQLFADGVAPTLLLVAEDRGRAGERWGEAEIVPLARSGDGFDPAAIRRALAERGLFWLFVEGGGVTISRFLAARALDRLQLTVAPVLLGSGRPSLTLPEIADPRAGLRPRIRRAAQIGRAHV